MTLQKLWLARRPKLQGLMQATFPVGVLLHQMLLLGGDTLADPCAVVARALVSPCDKTMHMTENRLQVRLCCNLAKAVTLLPTATKGLGFIHLCSTLRAAHKARRACCSNISWLVGLRHCLRERHQLFQPLVAQEGRSTILA